MGDTTVVADQVNFTVDEGAVRTLVFTDHNSDGSLVDLTGITVAFVVEAVDGSQTLKILSTDVSNPAGSVAIPTPTNGQATVTLNAVSTYNIFHSRGGFSYWALWAQPGTPLAYTILDGQITPNRVAQP